MQEWVRHPTVSALIKEGKIEKIDESWSSTYWLHSPSVTHRFLISKVNSTLSFGGQDLEERDSSRLYSR